MGELTLFEMVLPKARGLSLKKRELEGKERDYLTCKRGEKFYHEASK